MHAPSLQGSADLADRTAPRLSPLPGPGGFTEAHSGVASTSAASPNDFSSRCPGGSLQLLPPPCRCSCYLERARVSFAPPADDFLAREVVYSHVRSLLAKEPVDILSSNQHTVKPWFTGKLDFSPPVKDLTAQGFSLIGGRIDYLDNRPVAALLYGRRQHKINLFIWPSAKDSDVEASTRARQGYQLIHWAASGMTFWAVSDLNTTELQEFGAAHPKVSEFNTKSKEGMVSASESFDQKSRAILRRQSGAVKGERKPAVT